MKETIGIELVVDDKNFTVNLKKDNELLQQFNRSLSKTATATHATESSLTRVARSFRQASVTVAALKYTAADLAHTFIGLPGAIGATYNKFERLNVLLQGLSDKLDVNDRIKEAGDNVKYLIDMSKNAPFSVDAMADAFVKMKVGGIDPLNGSLQALIDANARFGGTSETLKRAAVAIQQMGGKGVVSMEELRQQLGEAVPTAIQYMARGVGLSMAQLQKKIADGAVESQEGLKRMFAVMRFENEGGAKRLMQTWGGVTARMKTSWDLLINDVGKSSFAKEAQKQMGALTAYMDSSDAKKAAADFGELLATLTRWAGSLAVTVKENIGLIKGLVVAWGALKLGAAAGGWAKSATAMFLGDAEVEKRALAQKKTVWGMSIRDYVVSKEAELATKRRLDLKDSVDRAKAARDELAQNQTRLRELLAQEARARQQLQATRTAFAAASATLPLPVIPNRAEVRRAQTEAKKVTGTGNFALNPLNAALSNAFGGGMATANMQRQTQQMETQINAIARQADVVKRSGVALQENARLTLLNVDAQKRLAGSANLSRAALVAQSVAAKVAGGALMLVGGWVGAVSLALQLGVLAWMKWGNAGDKAIKVVKDAINNGLANSGTVAAIDSQIAEEEKNRQAALFKRNDAQAELSRAYAQGKSGAGLGFAPDNVTAADKELAASEKKLTDLYGLRIKATEQAVANDANDAVGEQQRNTQRSMEEVGSRYLNLSNQVLAEADEHKKAAKTAKERDAIEQAANKKSREYMAEAAKAKQVIAQGIVDANRRSLERLMSEGASDEQINIAKGKLADSLETERQRREEAVTATSTLDDMTFSGGKKKKTGKSKEQKQAEKIQNVWDRVDNLREQMDEADDNLLGALTDSNLANLAGTNLERVRAQVLKLDQAMVKAGGSAGKVKAETKDLISTAALKDLAQMALNMRDESRDIRTGLIQDPRERAQAEYDYEMKIASAKYDALMKEVADRDDAAQQIKQIEADKAGWILARQARLAEDLKTPLEKMTRDWREQFPTGVNNMVAQWADQSINYLAEFTETGKLKWREMLVSWLQDLNRMVLQKTFAGTFNDIFSKAGEGIKGLLRGISGGSIFGAGDKNEGVGALGSAASLTAQALQELKDRGISESTRALVENALKTATNTSIEGTATANSATSLTTLAGASQLATQALLNLAASQGASETAGIVQTIANGLAGLGGGGAKTFPVKFTEPTLVSGKPFANGGIMTQFGPVSLRKYANGGIARSPQLAIYGEGKTAEAYVPLPDGRSIPVTVSGTTAGTVAPVSITINVTQNSDGKTSEQSSADTQSAWRGAADQMRQIALKVIAEQSRAGGMLRNR